MVDWLVAAFLAGVVIGGTLAAVWHATVTRPKR